MKLGVVSTHTPTIDDGNPMWLPGAYRGGAELSDAEYLAAAPYDVEWEYTTPEEAESFDRVLVSSIDQLSDDDCRRLAPLSPIVFLHHAPNVTPERRRLVESARVVMLHTPAQEFEVRKWSEPKRVELVLSAIDLSEISRSETRERFALVACRDHPLKGIKNARIWAAREGYPLYVYTREDRSRVLEAMSRAEVFVHLPLVVESECRSVIEAVLSGCRVVTNDLVGITSVPGWQDPTMMRYLVERAPVHYWNVVCDE